MYHSNAMYYPTPCHPWPPCDPCGCAPCCCGPVTLPANTWCPPQAYTLPVRFPVVVPKEVSVDSSATLATAEALIGGNSQAHLTLEYLPDATATTRTIDVTIEADGSTSSWSETTITDGYQVKSDFIAVAPGSKVTLNATNVAARLRWCETVCC